MPRIRYRRWSKSTPQATCRFCERETHTFAQLVVCLRRLRDARGEHPISRLGRAFTSEPWDWRI